MTFFWLAIVAGLYVFGWTERAQTKHSSLHGWNAVITAGLVVASAAWFLFVMVPGIRRRMGRLGLLCRRPHLLVAVGVVLVVTLAVISGYFVGLVFACIGVTVFVIDGWLSLIPVGVLAATFVYVTGGWTGGWRSHTLTQIGITLFSVVPIIVVVYSLAAVMRQRGERDRLIDELRLAQSQLQQANRDLHIALARDVEVATLRERNRLAREMHDSIGHALVLIAMKIEAGQRLQQVAPAKADAEWESTKLLVRETMAELRISLAGLRIPALDEQGFVPAMSDLCDDAQSRSGVSISASVPCEANDLDHAVQEALYRITQEALNNVAKRARARRAAVRIEIPDDSVTLEVSDDGIGLAGVPRSEHERFGVVGMRERVEALGGRFTIGPTRTGGTVVRAVVPQKEEAGAQHPHSAG
jgi:signal transduction histidine kinase